MKQNIHLMYSKFTINTVDFSGIYFEFTIKGTIVSSPSRIWRVFLDFSFLGAILDQEESPTVSKLTIQ